MKQMLMITAIVCMAICMTACGAADQYDDTVQIGEVRLPDTALKDVFERHGLKAGTCISSWVLSDQAAESLVAQQFNSLTLENAMKPDSILNLQKSRAEKKIVVEYGDDAKNVLAWAKEHGMAMRGHTLIWYSQTPEWIFHENFDEQSPYVGREEMLVRMEDLIKGSFDELERLGYSDLFYAYDVINEGWMEDGSIRRNHWSDIIGDDYFWYAFYFADKYAPENIDLYYNDYNEQYKAETIADFVKTLVDDNGEFLIDGIGLQSHLFTADDLDTYFEGLDILSQTGLKLQITELDVGLGSYLDPQPAGSENLNEQARYYNELFSGLFERIEDGRLNMDAVTFWGVSDGYSWRSEYSPLLFDEKLMPKEAFRIIEGK